ncbi:histidine kinase [Algibacter miyuki]|uniref:Histidine kinase n=1 Tax=Algibacter miyuki TaxID=1306933 RepID=A0ABV5H431_9FLAO|nr:histidine kinase [Algibacter miyuki]MDN3665600.1 histidine kinase [Algibacter miyuki]
MRTEIENYNTIAKNLKKDYPKLSDFEILSLSIQIERNQILENGLVVSTSDKTPSGLESIGIALGYTDEQFKTTITDVLKEIVPKE